MDSDQEEDKHVEDTTSPVDIRKESLSEPLGNEYEEKAVVLLTSDDFKEWSDNSPVELPVEDSMYGVKISIRDTLTKGSGLTGYTTYNIVGEDKNGAFDIQRRYSEFNYLRKKLLERWPGVFIPAVPTKQILNKNDVQVTKNRQRFLNEFLRKISDLPYLYQSQQVQVFLRSAETDIVKVLQKFRKQSIPQLLTKYQQAFPDCVSRDDILKQKEQNLAFVTFVKGTDEILDGLKKNSRDLAESRDRYNKVAVDMYQKTLPRYQVNTVVQFAEGSESGCLFKGSQYPELEFESIREISTRNPFWLLYDLLKFQQRQAKGMKEAIKELDDLIQKREDMIRKIEINTQEISELGQGKTTLRSLVTLGTKEEIVVKLTAENQQLNASKDQLLQIINIATIHVSQQINKFKISRIRFFNKVLKKVFSVEMHNVEVAVEFSRKLQQVSEKFTSN